MITQCYDYLKRNSYEQTDQSAHKCVSSKKYLKINIYQQTDQSTHNLVTSNNENTALRLFKMKKL